jgi:hypothetical protein
MGTARSNGKTHPSLPNGAARGKLIQIGASHHQDSKYSKSEQFNMHIVAVLRG